MQFFDEKTFEVLDGLLVSKSKNPRTLMNFLVQSLKQHGFLEAQPQRALTDRKTDKIQQFQVSRPPQWLWMFAAVCFGCWDSLSYNYTSNPKECYWLLYYPHKPI